MHRLLTLPGRQLVLTYLLASLTFSFLSAQSRSLDGAVRRQTAVLQPGLNQLELCNLEPGRSYFVTFNYPVIDGVGFDELAAHDQIVQADAPCVRLTVPLAGSTRLEASVSIAPIASGGEPAAESSADFTVTANPGDANALVQAMFGGANTGCYEISNAVRSGNVLAFGAFAGGNSSIGLGSGLVVATGPSDLLDGANTQSNASGGFNTNSPDDPNLDQLAGGNQYDVAFLEFDIVATTPVISFQFVFGSEEYCEWSTSSFNDVFGLFISGPGISGAQNLARLPVTNQVVSVNAVNQFSNTAYFVNNVSPCSGLPQAAPTETQLDGWTTVLNATANVTPGATYRFKIAIADINDSDFTSAVFIRGQAGPSQQVNATVAPSTLPEGCQPAELRFARTNNDNLNQPLVVNFTVGGTATPGVDYAALPSPIVIPAGQNEVVVPITAYADFAAEGPETITFSVPDACAPDFTVTINDVDSLTVAVADQAGCVNTVFGLGAVVAGGVAPYTYAWSNGSTAGTVLVSDVGVQPFSVTVTDACGVSATASATATVYAEVVIDTAAAVCPGAPVVLFGETFTSTGTFQRVLPGANGQCDTTVNIVVAWLPAVQVADTLALCPGDSVLIGGVLYGAPGVAVDSLPGSAGQCDTVVTTTLVPRPASTVTDTLTLCPSESVLIGGVLYTAPGLAVETLSGTPGQCDTVRTVVLTLREPVKITVALVLCPGDSVWLGGAWYGAPAVVVDTLTGASGQCDTVRTTVLELQPAVASEVKLTCPGAVTITVDPGVTSATVSYDAPTGFSADCPCPELSIVQTSGLPSGSEFPVGTTTNCFVATDACGNSGTCCTTVTVEEEGPCDVQTNGCIKWEIIDITKLPDGTKRYRMRVTNYCTPPLINAIFQLPNGITAVSPANGSTYTAPSGRTYTVKNPNWSTFYSIRFNATQPGIANGQSDIFEYRLPPQANNVLTVRAQVRLAPATYIQMTQNTFNCDPDLDFLLVPANAGPETVPGATERTLHHDAVTLYPNPASDVLLVDVPESSVVPVRVLDARGAVVLHTELPAGDGARPLELPATLRNGMYLLELRRADGQVEVLRFVVVR